MEVLELSGKHDVPIDEFKVIFKHFNPKAKLDDEQMIAAMMTMNVYMKQNPLPPAPESFEIDGIVYRCPDHPLELQVDHFKELANAKIKDGSFEYYNWVAALIYQEDHLAPFNGKRSVEVAKMLWTKSCKFSLWGMEKYKEMLSLLRDTFPILYEKKGDDEEDEGVRAFGMVNALAKDDPTRWAEAGRLQIATAFRWIELKEIESRREKQRQRNNRVNN